MKRVGAWGTWGFGALVGVAAHLAAQLALWFAPRWVASEDDGYRLYQAYLLCSGQADPIGRFWLPGQLAMTCPFSSAGVPPVVAGVLVSTLSLAVLALALAALARRLAPADHRVDAGRAALVLVLASPMALTLSHSALAELPATAACALAALALVARVQGARPGALVAGSVCLLVATWTRYECWLLAATYPLAARVLLARAGKQTAWRDAAVAALAWLGPLAWLLLQWRQYGDPFAFVRATAEITQQGTSVGALAVIGHRLYALALWAPLPLVWVVLARRAPFGDVPARTVALGFLAWMAMGVLVPALTGDEHPVFPERLAFALEIGLVPLAALAWSSWRQDGAAAAGRRAPPVALQAAVVLGAALQLGLAFLRPPVYLDPDSVAFGQALRDGRVTPPAGGRLLVERPERRPPLGWASVASIWAAWPRLYFGTPAPERWEIVAPTDVRQDRWQVSQVTLEPWLARHDVTGVWCVTPICLQRITEIWPGAAVHSLGHGRFVSR